MEEDIAIADIKVQMEGDGKVQKEKQEVDQKSKRWTRKVVQKREMPFCNLSPAMGTSLPEKSLAL